MIMADLVFKIDFEDMCYDVDIDNFMEDFAFMHLFRPRKYIKRVRIRDDEWGRRADFKWSFECDKSYRVLTAIEPGSILWHALKKEDELRSQMGGASTNG